MSTQGNSEGGWPGGWLVAVVAGVIAAILARWIGDVGMAMAVLVGIFVFLVFGVLLGMFWSDPASEAHSAHDHGHGSHDNGHGAHGHEGGTAAAASLDIAAAPHSPPEAVPVPVMVAPAAANLAKENVSKPVALSGPRGGVADKLQTIEGIGPALEKLCHDLGIYHFDQIAAWGPGEVAWMGGNLKGFKGRVTRDRWVRQAGLIGEVGVTEFQRRAKTNEY